MEDVIKEAIFLVPETCAPVAKIIHGSSDIQEVFPEFAGDVFVGGIDLCQLERDGQQVQTVHAHPAGSIGLLDKTAGGQRSAAVKHTDIVESEESALKHVAALGILAVDPPSEVEQQFVKDA